MPKSAVAKKLNKLLRDYFSTTQREANGILILFIILIIFTFSPLLFPYLPFAKEHKVTEQDQQLLDSLVVILDEGYERRETYFSSKKQEKEKPTVTISKNVIVQSEQPITPKDINKANAIDLIKSCKLPQKLAKRVISFRDKLGGFYSAMQLDEVYGISSSQLQKVKKYFLVNTNFQPSKLRINNLTFKEILAHPYFNYEQTKSLFSTFRNQKKTILKIDMLVDAGIIAKHDIHKYLPYLNFN